MNLISNVYHMEPVKSRTELREPPESRVNEITACLDLSKSINGKSFYFIFENGKWSEDSMDLSKTIPVNTEWNDAIKACAKMCYEADKSIHSTDLGDEIMKLFKEY